MKKSLALLSAISLLYGCGSTKITRHKQLSPLPKMTKIKVYHESQPTFTYEEICTADVNSKGMFTSTEMKGYIGKAEKIARECGAKMAIIESLSGFSQGSGANVNVTIKAIKQTSEEAKLYKKEKYIKRLATAVSQNQIKTIQAILKKFKVSTSPKKRSNLDSAILDQVIRLTAEKGKACATKSMYYLYKYYGARIDRYSDYETKVYHGYTYSDDKTYVRTSQILNCPSSLVYNTYMKSEDKEKAVSEISDAITTSANTGTLSQTEKKNYLKLYPKFMPLVNKACDEDLTKRLCSLKTNLNKLYKYITRK